MGEGLSAGDILALAKENGDGFLEGNGIIILILFFLIFGFGGNWGNRGNGNCETQAAVNAGLQYGQLDNGIRSLANGICDLGYAGLQQTNATQAAIANLGYQTQQCCCETNRNIDAVRAENYKNTCEITTAIHSEGEATRALITANVMQELRDQNQAYQLQLSNQAQSANLIAALRPTPIPAYITCSPYEATRCGCACGNGYGCCGV